MSRVLYFDCFSGASGDMVLGALIDAGLPVEVLREALGSLALEGVDITADRVLRAGVSATKFRVIETAVASKDPSRETAEATHAHHPHEHAHNHAHAHEHDRAHGHPHAHEHASAHEHGHAHQHDHLHDHGHGHSHDHAHAPGHGHRSLREIEALIGRSALSVSARARAVELFRRLAEAEAAIHQMTLERVHLHEVGALDSIIDIVGGVFALEWFKADRIVASPLNTGSGMVDCAHGRFPVPAPATARLLRGVPVYASGPSVELLTPTGALLVVGAASAYGPLPSMRIDAIGYGAGDRDFASTPNVLRVFVGEECVREESVGEERVGQEAQEGQRAVDERVVVLECEIDDMNPQLFGPLMEALLEAGALDVYFVPVQMKKNRPGTLVTVLAPPERRAGLSEIVFRETTTLGLRYHEMLRERLERRLEAVETPWGRVGVKVASRGGAWSVAPEFEDCVRLARAAGVAVRDVQAAAVRAWEDAR